MKFNLFSLFRLTSYWGDDLVQQFHTGAFPDFLYNGSQFFIGLLKVTCSEQSMKIAWNYSLHMRLEEKNILYMNCMHQVVMHCTFCFDLESSPHQGEQGGVEGDGAITVKRHVHTNQTLQTGNQENLCSSEE